MATIKDFEDLEIWQLSGVYVNHIYSDFPNCKDFNFRNQLTSAGISIMNNIAEGFNRRGDAEFRQFLNISKGSAGEVKSMYYIAEDQKYVTFDIAVERRNVIQGLINGISSFMNYLKPDK